MLGKYSFLCIVPGCEHQFIVEAENRTEAIEKVINEGSDHMYNNHQEMPILSDEKIKSLVVRGVKKIE